MAVVGIGAEADIGDDDDLREIRLDAPYRLLHDPVRRERFRRAGVFRLRQAEEQHARHARSHRLLDRVRQAIDGEMVDAGHRADLLAHIEAVRDEEGQDELRRMQPRLLHEAAERRRLPQAAETLEGRHGDRERDRSYAGSCPVIDQGGDEAVIRVFGWRRAPVHMPSARTASAVTGPMQASGMRRSVSTSSSSSCKQAAHGARAGDEGAINAARRQPLPHICRRVRVQFGLVCGHDIDDRTRRAQPGREHIARGDGLRQQETRSRRRRPPRSARRAAIPRRLAAATRSAAKPYEASTRAVAPPITASLHARSRSGSRPSVSSRAKVRGNAVRARPDDPIVGGQMAERGIERGVRGRIGDADRRRMEHRRAERFQPRDDRVRLPLRPRHDDAEPVERRPVSFMRAPR